MQRHVVIERAARWTLDEVGGQVRRTACAWPSGRRMTGSSTISSSSAAGRAVSISPLTIVPLCLAKFAPSSLPDKRDEPASCHRLDSMALQYSLAEATMQRCAGNNTCSSTAVCQRRLKAEPRFCVDHACRYLGTGRERVDPNVLAIRFLAESIFAAVFSSSISPQDPEVSSTRTAGK